MAENKEVEFAFHTEPEDVRSVALGRAMVACWAVSLFFQLADEVFIHTAAHPFLDSLSLGFAMIPAGGVFVASMYCHYPPRRYSLYTGLIVLCIGFLTLFHVIRFGL